MLHDYVEIFAWSYEDMPGLDTNIVDHRLPNKADYPPVKQKVHRMRLEMFEKIKADVMKQFDSFEYDPIADFAAVSVHQSSDCQRGPKGCKHCFSQIQSKCPLCL